MLRRQTKPNVSQTKCHFEGPSTNQQPFLSLLYQTLFTVAYYGWFRIGEITTGAHPVLAKYVHIAFNKKKLKFILRSSKTHGKNNEPQIIKLSSVDDKIMSTAKGKQQKHQNGFGNMEDPCPYELMRQYTTLHGPYRNSSDPFFVFKDGRPVTPYHMRTCLKAIMKEAGYNQKEFSGHSFRKGRSNDLLKLGLSVETIKKIGRWKSNAVFKYLK